MGNKNPKCEALVCHDGKASSDWPEAAYKVIYSSTSKTGYLCKGHVSVIARKVKEGVISSVEEIAGL